MDQSLVKPSLEFNNLADKAVDDEIVFSVKTKLEMWEQLGNQLEIDGYPKEKICSTIKDVLHQKLAERLGYAVRMDTAHFYSVMNDNEWTDPSYARNTKLDPETGTEYSSIYSGQNKVFVNGVRELKQLCAILESSFKSLTDSSGQPLEISDKLAPLQIKQFVDEMKQIAKLAKNAADQKTKVHPIESHLFRYCLRTESGMLAVCKIFLLVKLETISHISKFITDKQARKFSKGQEPNMLALYTPKNRDDALFSGRYGVECPECKSWRVDQVHDGAETFKLNCIDCDHTFARKTLSWCRVCQTPLYDDVLQKIKKSGVCPECKHKIALPASFTA